MEQMQPDSRQILNIDLLHSLRVMEARPNGCSCQAEQRDLNILAGSGLTETASLCCNAGQNTHAHTNHHREHPLWRRRATARLRSLSFVSVSKTETITAKTLLFASSLARGSRSGRSGSRRCSSRMLYGANSIASPPVLNSLPQTGRCVKKTCST